MDLCYSGGPVDSFARICHPATVSLTSKKPFWQRIEHSTVPKICHQEKWEIQAHHNYIFRIICYSAVSSNLHINSKLSDHFQQLTGYLHAPHSIFWFFSTLSATDSQDRNNTTSPTFRYYTKEKRGLVLIVYCFVYVTNFSWNLIKNYSLRKCRDFIRKTSNYW